MKIKSRKDERAYNKFGSLMIICEYRNKNDIDVYFPEYNWTYKNNRYINFSKGSIKCPYEPRVCGKGYIGEGIYKSRDINGKLRVYEIWNHILQRCYDEEHRYNNKTYIDCYVCDEWLNYQNFAEWYENNYYEIIGEVMHIDKDILLKGNRVYSPETCIFVPQRINNLFTSNKTNRNNYLGVYKCSNGLYKSSCNNLQKQEHLGYFNTPEEAFMAYKTYKEQLIKQTADEYKDYIPYKLYEALYNYEVDITD